MKYVKQTNKHHSSQYICENVTKFESKTLIYLHNYAEVKKKPTARELKAIISTIKLKDGYISLTEKECDITSLIGIGKTGKNTHDNLQSLDKKFNRKPLKIARIKIKLPRITVGGRLVKLSPSQKKELTETIRAHGEDSVATKTVIYFITTGTRTEKFGKKYKQVNLAK